MIVTLLLLWPLISLVTGECRYRDLDLPQEVFSYWASWGCYIYTRPDFFYNQPVQTKTCLLYVKDMSYNVPGIHKGIFCYPFHHSNAHVAEEVDKSFWNNRTTERWIECTNEAEECCSNVMAGERADVNRCPSVWDGWSCFRSIPQGQNYQMVCSRFAYGYEPPRCHHFSYKMCFTNATWNIQTDYSSCNVTPPLIFRNRYYIGVLSFSIVFCIPALLVLSLTKAAKSQKLRIIRALLFVICIHNLMVILVRALIIMPELTTTKPMTTLMYRNTVGCRCITFLEKFTGNVVFGCMLMIGIFLHQLLTNLFRIHDRNNTALMMPFYLIAGTIASGSAAGWTVTMAKNHDHNCWQVSDEGHVDWLLDGPRLAMLVVNLVLLLHITVRLWHAFNAKESDESPFLRALKAALICLPVFGMQFLFLIIRPDQDNCGTEQFYYILTYTIAAAQGIFIAIFHCYTERDVSKHFVEWWMRLKGICQKGSILHRRSTVTETHHELVEHNLTPPQREQRDNRQRSVSLPDR